MDFSVLATKDVIDKTIASLKANGIESEFVETAEEAKGKALEYIPAGAEVMTMTSVTNDAIGLNEELNTVKYNSVKNQLMRMDRATQSHEMQKLGAAPEYSTGSAHALTEDGKIVIASNTGSQLPAQSYGASKVILIVGAQKIVPNLELAMQRIYEYVLPKESIRARKAYGLPDTWNSSVSKMLIINKEVTPQRIHVIIVNQQLGF